jgi:hypothetical protein
MSEPMTASIAIQINPLPNVTDVDTYAGQLTSYLAAQLERFAEHRGADIFLVVTCKQGDEHHGGEYRSGHYVKDPT